MLEHNADLFYNLFVTRVNGVSNFKGITSIFYWIFVQSAELFPVMDLGLIEVPLS